MEYVFVRRAALWAGWRNKKELFVKRKKIIYRAF